MGALVLCGMTLLGASGCPAPEEETPQGCATGATRCGPGGVPQQCAADGSGYVDLAACAAGEVCKGVDGEARCAPESCVANRRFCHSGDVWSCDAGGSATGVHTACAAGEACVVEAGVAACKASDTTCTAGEQRCGDTGVETCKADGSGFEETTRCDAAERCEIADGAPACLTPPAPCTPGQTQCSPSGDVLMCQDDGFSFEVSQRCTAGTMCVVEGDAARCKGSVCTPGAQRCSGAGDVEVCVVDGTGYETLIDCPATASCQVANGQPECYAPPICFDGQTRCATVGGAQVIERCDATRLAYEPVEVCPSNAACQLVNNAHQCAPQVICEAGDTRCGPAGDVEVCSADRTSYALFEQCGAGEVCRTINSARTCAPATCAANTSFCFGREVWSCNGAAQAAGRLRTCGSGQVCQESGGVADCAPESTACTPGQTRCAPDDSRIVEECRTDGSGYQTRATCAGATICQVNNGLAACQPDAGASCTPGARQCDGATITQCAADGRSTSLYQDCAALAGGQICTISTSTGAPTCTPQIVCSPGVKRCGASGDVEVCKADGSGYELDTDCTTGQACQSAGGVTSCVSAPVCAPGSSRCAGDVVEQCNALGSAYVATIQCAAPTRCQVADGAASCVMMQVCTPGEQRCAGDTIEQCEGDGSGFAATQTCAGGAMCQAAGGVATCQGGEPVCSAGEQRCNASCDAEACAADALSFQVIADCTSSQVCQESGGSASCVAAPVCTPGEQRCATANIIEQCNAQGTAFVVSQTCAGGALCQAAAGVASCVAPPACTAGQTRCATAPTVEAIQQCNAARTGYVTIEPCPENALCQLPGGVPTCVPQIICSPGVRRCGPGGNVEICNATRTAFEPDVLCGAGETCRPISGNLICAPASCVANRRFCYDRKVWSCNAAGQTSGLNDTCDADEICSVVAGVASCNPETTACTAGQTRCAPDNDKLVEVCKNDGSGYQAQMTCTGATICTGAVGAASCNPDPAATCTPGARQCDGDTVAQCAADGRGTFVYQDCAALQGNQTCTVSASTGAPGCAARVVTCADGYFYDGVDCQDVNECAAGTAQCDAICVNTDGGYDCVSSVADPSSPYWAASCPLSQQLDAPTGLPVDCRCATNRSLTGGLSICWRPFEANTREPSPFGAGVRVGAHPQAHIYGGFFDAAAREVVAVVDWSGAQDPDAGFVMAFDVSAGDRRVISGRYLAASGAATDQGAGPALAKVQDVQRGADGKLYVLGGDLTSATIWRVDPATGARSVVWALGDAAYGQCDSGRGQPSVQVRPEGFAMEASGAFLLGFSNTGPSGEGLGIIRVSADGSQCGVVSRAGTMSGNAYAGQAVGGGHAWTSGTLRGFSIQGGELLALNSFDLTLYAINLSTGARRRVSSSASSSPFGGGTTGAGGIGHRWVTYDAGRQVYWTVGRQGDTQLVLVEPATGDRHDLYCPGEVSTLAGVGCVKGSLSTGLSLGYGGFWLDPSDANIAYFAHDSMGLVKYEISTGNSFILSL